MGTTFNAYTYSTIDFGPDGSNEASYVVTGQSGIVASSKAEAFFMNDITIDHSANDHLFVGNYVNLTCGNIVPNVGFTIYAKSTEKLIGKYRVRRVWV